MDQLTDYERQQAERVRVQHETVNALNALTSWNNGRVHAWASDQPISLCCATDSAHGEATVYVVVDGELYELCGGRCGIRVVRALVADRDGPDHIDVEVRW